MVGKEAISDSALGTASSASVSKSTAPYWSTNINVNASLLFTVFALTGPTQVQQCPNWELNLQPLH